LLRARFGSGAGKKVKQDKKFTYSALIHSLCKTYKWKLDYVLSLTIRQIRELIKGEREFNEFIGNKDVDNPAKGKINNINDMMQSGIFKVRKK